MKLLIISRHIEITKLIFSFYFQVPLGVFPERSRHIGQVCINLQNNINGKYYL